MLGDLRGQRVADVLAFAFLEAVRAGFGRAMLAALLAGGLGIALAVLGDAVCAGFLGACVAVSSSTPSSMQRVKTPRANSSQPSSQLHRLGRTELRDALGEPGLADRRAYLARSRRRFETDALGGRGERLAALFAGGFLGTALGDARLIGVDRRLGAVELASAGLAAGVEGVLGRRRRILRRTRSFLGANGAAARTRPIEVASNG